MLLIMVSLYVSYILTRYIKKAFIGYRSQINAKNKELFGLNETLEERVAQRTQELNKASEKLEILATTDSLTNIHNRYSIMKILDLEINRARRHHEPLSIFMYDLDYFKRVNDTYGHHVGDETLLELTKVVQKFLRDIDYIGRYGGEEFAIIMANVDKELGLKIADRLRLQVETFFKNDPSIPKVRKLTVSVGLSVWPLDARDKAKLIKCADLALYHSKGNGKNMVSVYSPEMDPK